MELYDIFAIDMHMPSNKYHLLELEMQIASYVSMLEFKVSEALNFDLVNPAKSIWNELNCIWIPPLMASISP